MILKNLSSICLKKLYKTKQNSFLYIEKRGRKYIPFYDIKKKTIRNKNDENTENENENENFEKNKKFEKELMPCISPYKAIKLLLTFKDSINNFEQKNYKIYINLIIKIDIKRESLRGMCSLLHSVEKPKKILVLIDDQAENEDENKNLKKYGADYVGLEYINKIKNGWLDFDICLTDFKNINKILPIAKILGPKKLMPNIKSETLVTNLKETIQKIKKGNIIEYRTEPLDDYQYELYNCIYNLNMNINNIANIKTNIGTTNMDIYNILANIKIFVNEIIKKNPHAAYDKNVKTSFVWPPSVSKTKQNINNNYTNETKNDSFLLGAYVTFESFPKIFLNSDLLYSHSTGYSI